ncbi:MAG: formate--tetrahydrofolate ligase [Deltaproteobacteria bacterium]|nr:MAG: formate--tetrahydrofolate ligase [Deltaproteobacteria bacterium]
MRPLVDVAADLGISPAALQPYGNFAAKVDPARIDAPAPAAPKLILVSAITPTPAGEGKTTTTIGLGDALARLGHRVCIALREPSLGPCMGIKGGGTGGGRAQVVPSDRINLHFTGDFHAITSAHNLIAAVLDNHIHFDREPDIDPRRVLWPRVLDMNDRALRHIVLGLGGKANSIPREGGFDITAASELMAILCLAEDADDLRRRIDRILVAFARTGEPVAAAALRTTGAALALLRDAMFPNLVQTLEGTPALVHGGPFANIAHGCNSVIATKLGLRVADWVVTEAGFGFDLGAEKFYDIKCRSAGLDTAAVVLVASVRALKLHGGVAVDALDRPNPDAVDRGLPNLEKHIENIHMFTELPVVALNRFGADTDEEIDVVRRFCSDRGIEFAVAEHFDRGAEGAVDLARAVVRQAERDQTRFRPLYELAQSVPDKIRAVATRMYGASDVAFTKQAERDLADIARLGYDKLPVCIAKTHSSLSDDPKLRGRPRDFDVTVRAIQINAGAGFLVVLTGDILRMPGLPRTPRAESIDLHGQDVVGLQ